MALRTLIMKKELGEKQAALEKLRTAAAGFEQREKDLSARVDAVANDEERRTLAADVDAFDAERAANKADTEKLEGEIRSITEDIKKIEDAANAAVRKEPIVDDRSTPEFLTRCAEFKAQGKIKYENLRSLIRAAVTTAGTVGPTGAGGINDSANGISSLVDLIKITDCTGMASYKVAYMSADGTADAITEGQAPAESEPNFGSVTLTPASYGLVCYVSREIRKQSPLQYEAMVRASVQKALRRKANALASAAILASSLNDELPLSQAAATGATLFDAQLLSKIILAYGGDEGVGAGYLTLNKADLKAFAGVRGTNEYLPVYSIVPDAMNPSTGIIKDNNGLSCRYVLDNSVPALSAATLTASKAKFMHYGVPTNCEMGMWGGLEINADESYKFAEGLITIRGELTAAVDVTVPKGFVVVTAKKTS